MRGEHKPWVRKTLSNQIGKINQLFRRARNLNSEEAWNCWKEQRNLMTSMNRKLKTNNIINQVKKLIENKQNPKQYHQILTGMVGRKRKLFLPPLIDENN